MFKYGKKLCALLILAALCSAGCSSNQTVRNAWKGTKGMWYTYVSPPASINYDDKGEMDAYELALATRMMGIDIQLSNLERVMSNADRPPTGEWMQAFFGRFPWVNGITGLKADGSIIGQEPGIPMKPLDFTPLLEEDKKQNLRALRGYVQDTTLGPEVFLAVPLYDAQDLLGIMAVHFDMRNLLKYSTNPDDLIILSPQAVLWAGNRNPETLTSVNWGEVISRESRGTMTLGGENFYWVSRYLGNQPLVFAVPVAASAEAGKTGTTQEGQKGQEGQEPPRAATSAPPPTMSPIAPASPVRPVTRQMVRSGGMVMDNSLELQPGSSDSMLLPSNSARPSPFGPDKKTEERKID